MKTMDFNFRRTAAVMLISFAGSVHSLTLDEAIKHTLASHPELKAANLEHTSRAHEIDKAKGDYLPEVFISTGIGREKTKSDSIGSRDGWLDPHDSAISARQIVFDGLATQSEVARQQARTSSAGYRSQAVSEELALQTAEVYIDVQRAAKLQKIALESKRNHEDIFEKMQKRRDAGVGSQADLDQITGRLALANANVMTTKGNLLDAQTRFRSVVGISVVPQDLPEIAGENAPKLPPSSDSAVELAKLNNPSLLAAQADVDATKAQYEASKSPFWPTVHLEANHYLQDEFDGVEGYQRGTELGVRVNYNLYNGGSNQAEKLQKADLLNEAQEVRNNTHLEVVQNVQLAWSNKETLTAQLPHLKQHAESSEATEKAYFKQFDIGRRTLLDLLNTENEKIDSQRAVVNASYDSLLANYRILSAIGGIANTAGATPAKDKL